MHLVGILFPHINDDAQSKSHQTPILGSLTFFRKSYRFDIMWGKCGRTRHTKNNNIILRMRFACWIGNRHTLRLCNTCCFSTATVVSRRRLNVTLYLHRLSYVCIKKGKGKGLPQQAEVTQGVPVRLRPRIFLTFQHYKGGRSSAKHTGRLYPMRNPWYSLSETESTSGLMVLSGETRKKSQ